MIIKVSSMHSLKPLYILLGVLCFIYSSLQVENGTRSFELSIINRINKTGHLNLEYVFVQETSGAGKFWQAKIKYENNHFGEIEKHTVKGYVTAPPPKPKDYKLFHGIGYYKFHTNEVTFHDAMSICAKEGGHLAIINSQEEANVLKSLHASYPLGRRWPLVGFYDLDENGTYVTIFGEPLTSTGYNKWHPTEPDHSHGRAHCGVIDRNSYLGVGTCNATRAFFCEYDWSWG